MFCSITVSDDSIGEYSIPACNHIHTRRAKRVISERFIKAAHATHAHASLESIHPSKIALESRLIRCKVRGKANKRLVRSGGRSPPRLSRSHFIADSKTGCTSGGGGARAHRFDRECIRVSLASRVTRVSRTGFIRAVHRVSFTRRLSVSEPFFCLGLYSWRGFFGGEIR